ncbi:hypothetical protein O7630_31685 [Micromonospora sp. WMMD718]|uniref:hypothetical protein n=1 Tax=Micromonospora sp. WMMD718 TaxID=3016098 RepID=UPI002416385E|nr:hypothetical protein [Micromonospora sp. WMMD718]MDG4755508.1 hypothetical protein [Micromonospora sp. WMMD718]
MSADLPEYLHRDTVLDREKRLRDYYEEKLARTFAAIGRGRDLMTKLENDLNKQTARAEAAEQAATAAQAAAERAKSNEESAMLALSRRRDGSAPFPPQF